MVDYADLKGQAESWLDLLPSNDGHEGSTSDSSDPSNSSISSESSQSLLQSSPSRSSSKLSTFLYIVGLGKSGKSTVLENLVPALAVERWPNAVFWSVDFREISEDGSDAELMLERLLSSGLAFADAHGIRVSM